VDLAEPEYDPLTFDLNDSNGKALKLVKKRSIQELRLFFSKADYSPWAKMKAINTCVDERWRVPLQEIANDSNGKYAEYLRELARRALERMNGQRTEPVPKQKKTTANKR
jgi:hypothetical protein